MTVSPRAASAAKTSDALARRSEAMTPAPVRSDGPATMACRPSSRILAPMRASSCACMKRFSKMVSTTMAMPCACVIRAMYCACRSVANPGYSSVVTSTDLSRFGAQICTEDASVWVTSAPACSILRADLHGGRIGLGDFGAGLQQLGHQRAHVFGHAIRDLQVAAGDGSGDEERARLDAVADDGVIRAVQLFDAAYVNRGSAGALDLRAHLRQQRAQIRDLRLARGVAQYGLAARQHGGHDQVFGAGHRDAVEVDDRATQPLRRFRFDVAVGLPDARAQLLQTMEVQVDGTRADGAPAGQGDARAARARHQRPQHQTGGAHGLHQLIRRFR